MDTENEDITQPTDEVGQADTQPAGQETAADAGRSNQYLDKEGLGTLWTRAYDLLSNKGETVSSVDYDVSSTTLKRTMANGNTTNIVTFDQAPTLDSHNPVTSGGVYAAIKDTVDQAHTHSNFDLLETYTQTETDLADAVDKKHAHGEAEQAALGSGITQEKVATYDDHLDNGDMHVTTTDKARWDAKQDALTKSDAEITDAVNKRHEHDNKALLDTYTQTEADLADAVAKRHSHTDEQYNAMNSGITKSKVDSYDAHVDDKDIHVTAADKDSWDAKQDDISEIIPAAATKDNQLADKAYVDAIGERLEARYLSPDASGNPFPTVDALRSATEYYYHGSNTDSAGNKIVPDQNDTTTVFYDTEHLDLFGNPSVSRYRWDGDEKSGQWIFEYTINNTGLNQSQLLAVNSGITSDKVTGYDTHLINDDIHVTTADKATWDAKQDALSKQTEYTAKGNATTVPQITTNEYGQVTGITEVTISGVTPAAHTHGNLSNDGILSGESNGSIVAGDAVAMTSSTGKLKSSAVVFDGTTTSTALTPKGTWEAFLQTETDPVFSASPAADISDDDMSRWDAKQDAIADLDEIRTNATEAAAAKHTHPNKDLLDKYADAGSSSLPVYITGGVPTAITVDTKPTTGSQNLITSGGVQEAISDAVESVHSHPNKAMLDEYAAAGSSSLPVYVGADGKPTAITVDTEPTEDSPNLITSGGVQEAIAEAVESVHTHANKELLDKYGSAGSDTTPVYIGSDGTPTTVEVDTEPTKDSPKLITSGGVEAAIESEASARDAADQETAGKIDSHLADKDNPHEVTAAQVGAYTADEVDELFDAWSSYVIVPYGQDKPSAGDADTGKIYIVHSTTDQEISDQYEKWVSDGTDWTLVGAPSPNLTPYDKTASALVREQELRDLIDSVAHGTDMVPFKAGQDVFMTILDYFATKPVPYAATFYCEQGSVAQTLTNVPAVLVTDNKLSGFKIEAFCLYDVGKPGTPEKPNYVRSILLDYTNNNSDAGYIKFLGRVGNSSDGRPSSPKNSYWEQFLNTSMCDGAFNYKSNKVATVKTVTDKINALDVNDTAVANQFVTVVKETDGKIAVTRRQPVIGDVSGLQAALDATALKTDVSSAISTHNTDTAAHEDIRQAIQSVKESLPSEDDLDAWNDAADKAHVHQNKDLLDTYTQSNADLGEAVSMRHSHTPAQSAAMDSGITASLVQSYSDHVADTSIHVTASDKVTWDGKQDKLTNTDAEIQDAVSNAHVHTNESELDKIASGDVAKWNAKQDAISTLTSTDVNAIWDSVT